MQRKFNADIGESIDKFKRVMKEFRLRKKLYRVMLRGRGLEFEGYRAYAPDDDASLIDWKASKRANKLLAKQYREEQNLKVVFIYDVSENMVLGSSEKLKCEYAAEVGAALAQLILSFGNKVGLITFSNEVTNYIPPMRGRQALGAFVKEITEPSKYGGHSDLCKAVEFAYKYLPSEINSVVFLSDFVSFNERCKGVFSALVKKFESFVLIVRDKLDYEMPALAGEVVLQDPRTGEQVVVNPKVVRKAYSEFVKKRYEAISRTLVSNRVDFLELRTDEEFSVKLAEFLKARVLRK
ncbi:DUF58 domain-containing protein [Candidatus Pacearchaeota archaeon]|nr:MAG: DUF58 domain-containing protein [Candidatus Pacearchaeota archaeon]